MMLLFLTVTITICDVLGCCHSSTDVQAISDRKQSHRHSPMAFMDLNGTRSIRRAWSVRKSNPKTNQALSYHSCHSIVMDLPLSEYRDVRQDEEIQHKLMKKCIRRWHQLIGDLPSDSQNVNRPSDSRTRNLIIFKLEGTVMDSHILSTGSYQRQIISQLNRNDFIFNQIYTNPHDPYSTELNLNQTLIIYRKGLMQLFQTAKSGEIKENTFDIALIGDSDFDLVFNAVAMETYFYWRRHYLRMVENDLFGLTSDPFRWAAERVPELQLNFVYAQRYIPHTALGRYHRVIIVVSNPKSTRFPSTVCGAPQSIILKVSPFLMFGSKSSGLLPRLTFGGHVLRTLSLRNTKSENPTGSSQEPELRALYNQRKHGDNSLDKVTSFLVGIDINAELAKNQEWVVIEHDQRCSHCNGTSMDQNSRNLTDQSGHRGRIRRTTKVNLVT